MKHVNNQIKITVENKDTSDNSLIAWKNPLVLKIPTAKAAMLLESGFEISFNDTAVSKSSPSSQILRAIIQEPARGITIA